MSQESPRHLPPEALDGWMEKLCTTLGIDEEVDIGALLDLTRDVAHDVARPAAPIATFALGLALGRLPQTEFDSAFVEFQEKITRLASEQQGL